MDIPSFLQLTTHNPSVIGCSFLETRGRGRDQCWSSSPNDADCSTKSSNGTDWEQVNNDIDGEDDGDYAGSS